MATHPVVRLYTDGGARGNPGPAAIGVVLCTKSDRIIEEYFGCIGVATNNEAEYKALIEGLKRASSHTNGEVHCYLDSELVVRQLYGRYKVRSRRLQILFDDVHARMGGFTQVRFEHLPRLTGRLKRADQLVNQALDRLYQKSSQPQLSTTS